MPTETIQQLIRTLKKAEKSGDLESLVAIFSEEAELSNLATPRPLRGKAGAYRFWKDYLAAFRKVETHFRRIIEMGSTAVLEWHSEGMLPSGRPFTYEGVTILDIDGGRITRFRAYYDSAVFVNAGQSGAKHEGAA